MAEAPWRVQVAFRREVALLHGAAWVMAGLVWLSAPPFRHRLWVGLGMLVVLAMICRERAIQGNWWRDNWFGTASAVLVGGLLRSCGFWAPFVGVGFGVLYVIFAGRNYSRMGHFVLSLIAGAVTVAVIGLFLRLSPGAVWLQMALLLVTLLYGVTDLTSITFRRRSEEARAAAVDLFTDVMNWIPWLGRLRAHRMKHKLWPYGRQL